MMFLVNDPQGDEGDGDNDAGAEEEDTDNEEGDDDPDDRKIEIPGFAEIDKMARIQIVWSGGGLGNSIFHTLLKWLDSSLQYLPHLLVRNACFRLLGACMMI
jgi:hypothetical protein